MKQKMFNKKTLRYTCAGLFAGLAFILFLVTYYSVAPSDFPGRELVAVKQGTYLSEAADQLLKKNIIKSPFLFKVFVVLASGHRQVLSGDYLFDKPESALRIAYRLANGVQNLPKIKITIFEGMTTKDISSVLKKNIPNFDSEAFLLLAKPYEGYLFPDTYYFYENTESSAVIEVLRDNFNEKIKTTLLAIKAFNRPIPDIITMASIVEKEATSSVDRKIIAGILWKRIDIGMPLQVDPPFFYFLNKNSADITTKDLATDSPYNMYKHKGLPPTPIDNPGLETIMDTITPVTTKYLFYLSDKKGNMHYAETHDGHLANKDKYIQ